MSELDLISELSQKDKYIRYSQQLLQRCEELKYTLKDTNFIPKTHNCKFILICNNNHEYETTYDKFIYSKTKCMKCKILRPKLSISDVIEKISNYCVSVKLISHSSQYKSRNSNS